MWPFLVDHRWDSVRHVVSGMDNGELELGRDSPIDESPPHTPPSVPENLNTASGSYYRLDSSIELKCSKLPHHYKPCTTPFCARCCFADAILWIIDLSPGCVCFHQPHRELLDRVQARLSYIYTLYMSHQMWTLPTLDAILPDDGRGSEAALNQVIDLLSDPFRGVAITFVLWTMLYQLVGVLPFFNERSFRFNVSQIVVQGRLLFFRICSRIYTCAVKGFCCFPRMYDHIL